MSLSLRVLEEISWWHDEMVQWSGLSFMPLKHSHVLTTEASSHAWVVELSVSTKITSS